MPAVLNPENHIDNSSPTWEPEAWVDAMPYDGAQAPRPPATIPRSLDLEHASHDYYPDVQLMKVEAGQPCRVCGRGAGDAFLCRQCAEEWEVHLGNVRSLVEDLNLAAQRRVRFGGREGNATVASGPTDWTTTRHLHTRHPSHTALPMPGDLYAAGVLSELQNELVGQVRTMCDTFDLDMPGLGSDTGAISMWLLEHADNLRRMEDSDGLVRDLDHVMQRGVNAIDAPKRPKYVCACAGCGLAVWAPPGETIVTCSCGRAYDVETTRTKRLLTAHDYLVSVREAHVLSGTPKSTIKSWIGRGRLTVKTVRTDQVEILRDGAVVGTKTVTVQIVRYGDVVNLIAEKSADDTPREA